ncbi:hypothetical protein [Nonomuraea typhae]|uniref:hypothetical protein n=1 Tax=Nonomuraea typhae TaxID=2603600 RepID=UPI0012F72F57|nr:hypothetical protein [Nonomuraea typhae]
MAIDMALTKRLKAIESRLSALEEERDANNETLYQLRRSTVRTELGVNRILEHLGLEKVTDAEVDEELDAR